MVVSPRIQTPSGIFQTFVRPQYDAAARDCDACSTQRFPNVDWMRQPWAILRQVTDPYLNLFRNLIPPIMGQIDFTPILGFMVLQFLAKVLSSDPSIGRF